MPTNIPCPYSAHHLIGKFQFIPFWNQVMLLMYILHTYAMSSGLLLVTYNYTIVWFLRAPRWYIGPTAMPRAAVTPIAPERSEGAIGCDSRPRHCRRDDIPAWRPNKITLLSLLPLDLMMYHRFISFMCAVQSREGRWFNPRYCL